MCASRNGTKRLYRTYIFEESIKLICPGVCTCAFERNMLHTRTHVRPHTYTLYHYRRRRLLLSALNVSVFVSVVSDIPNLGLVSPGRIYICCVFYLIYPWRWASYPTFIVLYLSTFLCTILLLEIQ